MIKSLHSRESKIFVSHFRTLREEAGMTQRDLASAVGWHPSVIAKIELGERRVDVIEYFWIIQSMGKDPNLMILKLFESLHK